jgi:hypothetical protein
MFWKHFARHRLAESDQPCLRRGVVGLAGVPHLPHDRADGDDATRAPLDHRPEDSVHTGEGRGEIGRDDLVPLVSLHAQHQLVAGYPGIVHQDVHAPVTLITPSTSA